MQKEWLLQPPKWPPALLPENHPDSLLSDPVTSPFLCLPKRDIHLFKQLKGIISPLCHDSEWNSFSIYFSSSVPCIIPILLLLSGFQHICNHFSCTWSFPGVNFKHSHCVLPLETLTLVIENAPGIFDFSSTTDTSSIYLTTTDSWSAIICSIFLHHLERKWKELTNQEKGEGMYVWKKILKIKQEHNAETTPKALAKAVSLVCKKKSMWKISTTANVRSLSWRWPKACCSTWDRVPLIAAHRHVHSLQKKTAVSHAQSKSPSPNCLFTSLLVQGRN